VWLCRPGAAHDPGLTSQTTTVVGADGSTKWSPPSRLAEPKVDCFYVYPTVSAQPTTNANYESTRGDSHRRRPGVALLVGLRVGSVYPSSRCRQSVAQV